MVMIVLYVVDYPQRLVYVSVCIIVVMLFLCEIKIKKKKIKKQQQRCCCRCRSRLCIFRWYCCRCCSFDIFTTKSRQPSQVHSFCAVVALLPARNNALPSTATLYTRTPIWLTVGRFGHWLVATAFIWHGMHSAYRRPLGYIKFRF